MTVTPSRKRNSEVGRRLWLRENIAEVSLREPTGRDSRHQPVRRSDFSAAQPFQLVIE
jgi:hypothetical protein